MVDDQHLNRYFDLPEAKSLRSKRVGKTVTFGQLRIRSDQIHRGYLHLDLSDQRDAVARLGSLL